MTDEIKKQVAALNEKHFLQFGTTPSGALKIQWMRTDEMYSLFKRGHSTVLMANGLHAATSVYKKRTLDEIYGPAWTVAAWAAPVPQAQWIAEFGTEMPWPREGMYLPIECIMRALSLPPDEAVTLTAVQSIKRHLEMTTEEKIAAAESPAKAKDKDMESDWQAFAKDSQTAFNNDPGGKGHVSFPSVVTH